MVLWLIGTLHDHLHPQKKWNVKIIGTYNGFLSLKLNILKFLICSFSLTCYTAWAPIIFTKLFHGTHCQGCQKSQEYISNYLIYPLLSVKVYWTSMKYHVYIYDRFSSFLSLYQSLWGLVIQCKDWFLT